MSKDNLTIFQRLNTVFNPDGSRQPKVNTINKYSLGDNTLIKTQDKEEYERAKLQARQSKYLGNVWRRVDGEMFQKSLHYEVSRIGSYSDFENMEFYPQISAALDVIMEESTTINDKGRVLNVYSNSKRVKSILEDLFFNRLDIQTSLPMWTRNTVKYGDNFVFMNIDGENGIVGGKQMPNYEMERNEGDLQSKVLGVSGDAETKTKFLWRTANIELNYWQVAHFRLLGDDRRLPYGTCLKYNTRVETLNGYKEIKDIKIGDIVYSFNYKTQERELSKVLDTVNSGIKTTYKISTKHNFIDASKEHKIMYYNVRTKSFEYKNTLDFKVGDLLVVNLENNNDELIIIDKTKPEDNKNGHWNNNESVPDVVDCEFARLFGYLIGDGWVHNDSVFIALSEHKSINDRYISYLNKITGREIKFSGGEDGKSQAICNSKMLSTILGRMGFVGDVYSKRIPQWVYSTSKEVRQAFLDGLIDADGSLFIDKWDCLRYSIELTNEELINDVKVLVQSLGLKSGKISNRLRTGGGVGDRKFKTQQESFYFYFYDSKTKQKIKYDFDDRLLDNFILEPIISIEESGKDETYDIYVENEYHNFYANGVVVHNSMLEKARRIWKQLILSEDAMLIYRITRAPERRVYKIYVGNIDDEDVPSYVDEIASRFKRMPIVDPKTGQIDLKFNQMANDQDFFIPVRSEDAPNPIDTLPGAQNLDAIADIEYLQRNLFTALRVPKSFLNYEDANGEGKNLALQDIRFTRTINRVQQSMIQELNKIAIIHLFLIGLEDEIDNFTLTLNNPSTQADSLRIENQQMKITLLKDAVSDTGNGFAAMSMTRAKREILGWSDDEIKQDLLEQRMEKAASAELANTNNVIKYTGVFDEVDRVYGDINLARTGGGEATEGGDETGGESGGGGGFGGGGFGGEIDFGEGGDEVEDTEGDDTGDIEGGDTEGGDETSAEPTEESKKKKEKLIIESMTDKLIRTFDKKDEMKNSEPIKIYNKSVLMNETINGMISDINGMIDKEK